MKKILFASFFAVLLSTAAFAAEESHDETMMDGSADASVMTEDEAHGAHHDGEK